MVFLASKVDALIMLYLCLEQNLTTPTATRRRLLDALLAEALEPVVVAEIEAAE